ncbi:MAG: chemotaxis protein CheW [Firmicutes bacterium]|nr:chemotaxis protein CheW [Bacillota bacterium]
MTTSQTAISEQQFVVFRLAEEEFALGITKVREIIKVTEITRLPHVAKYIEGVTNLRGEVIPVVNLRKRFGLEEEEETQDTRIIIVDIDSSKVGFIVDEVKEVLRVPSDAIDPPPSNVAGLSSTYLEGIAKHDDRLLILLHIDRIMLENEPLEFSKLEKHLNN